MERVLVVGVNWIGDVLFSEPALRAVKQKNEEDTYLAVMVPSRCRRILEHNPAIDEIIDFNERRYHKSLFSQLRFIRDLRKKNFDKAIFFHRSCTRIILCLLAGIKKREGYYRTKTKLFLTKTVPSIEKDKIHKAGYYMNLVERLGYPVKDKKYRFFVTESNLQEAENLLSSNGVDLTNDYLIALHPGANWRPKRWPQTYYAKLIDLLLSSNKRNYKIIITGEKEDKELASNIKERVKRNVNKVVDLCGQTTLGSLAGVFSYCKSLVSGDTGALHIGCALKADPSLNRDDLDVYCVGLFGPTCSNLTGPLNGHYKIIEGTRKDTCQVPCYDYTCRDYVCMNSILPQKVADTIEDI